MMELIGIVVGLLLTLFIYSYLAGDNPLYRLSLHILVGVGAAYAAVIVVQQVLSPIFQQIQQDAGNLDNLLWLAPIFLGALLLLKRLPTIGWLGNLTMAVLIGIGAAVAFAGALVGTVWPQITAVSTRTAIFPGQGVVAALLTICTLLVFQFTGKRNREGEWMRAAWQRPFAFVGQVVMTITFGALFAGVLNSSLILLADRLSYYFIQLWQ